LGNGVYRRRVQGASTSQTSHLGVTLTRDKHATKEALRAAGIPVPEGVLAGSADLAVKAAESIGFPVAVKPLSSGDSAGVSLDLIDAPSVAIAYERAAPDGSAARVIVERYFAGNDYRALLVNDQIIGVKERIPAHVTGDGEHTIEELIDIANADPRRAPGSRERLVPIAVDPTTLDLLARHGHSLDGIAPPGQVVRLKPNPRRADGGTTVDRTDEIHPDNADLLRWTARIVGLDIAGIDFVAQDVARSIWETGGAILEINDHPAIGTFLNPTHGQPRDPGPAIIDMLFPPGQPVRVPIVAVTGTGDRTSLVHEIAGIMSAAGYSVGLAAADGLFVNGTHLRGVDPGAGAARKVLNNPAVELAVIEVDPLEIREGGLCFDYCDVAVVLAASEGAPEGFAPPEAVVCRIVALGGTVVLDAANPHAAELMDAAGGEVVLAGEDPDDRFAAIEHALRSIAR
jgi:cyanophycin synthetase